MGPVLYSFRRCPYAMRARLALAVSAQAVELREVSLKAKPPELLEASPKGTVPVLVLPDGTVIEESLTIMRWALEQADPLDWLQGDPADSEALIAENDGPFKHHLDRFKYPDRYPGETSAPHRRAALAILECWNQRLAGGGWLLGARASLADWALLPFVRQFRLADPEGFAAEPGLDAVRTWLARFEYSELFQQVMESPWAERHCWRSPRWLYHLALPSDWQQARQLGDYRISTRGQSLQQVGFIHASYAHQLERTHQCFYSDVSDLRVLVIDPDRLAAYGIEVRPEAAPGSGELFPHLYGPLPLDAVCLVERW
jgi:glutathione S-transferase